MPKTELYARERVMRSLHDLRRRELPAVESDIAALRDDIFELCLQDPTAVALIRRELLELTRTSENHPEVRSILERSLAETAVFLGKLTDANSHYARSVELGRLARRPDLHARPSVGWIHVLGLLGRSQSARKLAARARRTLQRLGDTEYLAKLAMNEGNLSFHEGRFRSAAGLYRSAATLLEQSSGEGFTGIQVRINEAIALSQLGSFEAALRVFREAESSASLQGLDYVHAHARFNRAELERTLGDYRSSLEGLELAGGIFETAGARDLHASTLRTRSEVFLELGMPSDATDLGVRAGEIFLAEGMNQDAGLSHLIAARAYRASREFGSAWKQLERSEVCLREVRSMSRELRLERVLLFLEIGDVPSARAQLHGLRPSKREDAKAGLDRRLALARVRVRLASGRLASAESLVSASISSSTASPLLERISLHRLAGEVARRRGDLSLSRRRWQHAARCLEDHRALLPNSTLRGSSFGRHLEVYLDLIRSELDRPRPDAQRMLDWSEAARARVLKDRYHRGRGTEPDRLARERAQLAQLLLRCEESERTDPAEGSRLRRELSRRERELTSRIRSRLEGGSVGRPRTSPSNSSQMLRRGEACVAFFCLPPFVLAFVLRDGDVSCLRLPTRLPEIEDQLGRFRFQLENAAAGVWDLDEGSLPRRALDHAMKGLYSALLEPVADRLGGCKRLLVVPHRQLHEVPFECFLSVEEQARSWIVSRVSSVQHLALRRRRVPSATGFVSLGVETPELPSVAREAETVLAIARRAGQSPAKKISKASRNDMLGVFSGHRAIHIATHGRFRRDNPSFSHLLCTDGALFVEDLDRLRIRAPLVFLSACETGQVADVTGDELESVAHALLSAGARRLVASRWTVDDHATLDLVRRFYEALWSSPRPDPARAMHTAMSDSLDSGLHPFHWGGFSVHEA